MKFLHTLFAVVALGGFALTHTAAAAPEQGKHYNLLQVPQPTEPAGKVEVIEFFWYGCSHCNSLEPHLKSWKQKLAADVSFRKVPAIFRQEWEPAARLYYSLEGMGLLDKLGDGVFDAIFKQRVRPDKEKELIEWAVRQGVDRQQLLDMYNSFGVKSRVTHAAKMTEQYRLSGVPAIVVGGKYLAEPAPGPELLPVVDFLIDKNRGEIKKK